MSLCRPLFMFFPTPNSLPDPPLPTDTYHPPKFSSTNIYAHQRLPPTLQLADFDGNLASPAEVSDLLFKRLKIPVPPGSMLGKATRPSTAAAVLEVGVGRR